MGIRISMQLMIGIDDLQFNPQNAYEVNDPRWEDANNWTNKFVNLPPHPTKRIDSSVSYTKEELEQTILFHSVRNIYTSNNKNIKEKFTQFPSWAVIEANSEYGIGNIVGITIAKLPYADKTLYALAAVYPEFREKSYRVLPSIDLENDDSYAAAILKTMSIAPEIFSSGVPEDYSRVIEEKRKLINNKQNYLWFSQDMGSLIPAALYIFNEVGLRLKEEELKLMLYWKWS